MIKVLELIDGGFLGGGQTNILSIIRNIDRKIFDIHVAAKGDGEFERAVEKSKTRFSDLYIPKYFRTKYLLKLKSIVEKQNISIIHSHGGVAGFYSRILKKHNRDIKIVHTIHGIHYVHSKNILRRNISLTIEQYLVQFTDKFICVSNNDFQDSQKLKIIDVDKTVTIPNGINITRYANRKKNLRLLKELGLTEENFIIGNVSRFDVQKNQKLIIQTAYHLKKFYPDMRFILVGGGELLRKHINYVNESGLADIFIFTGEVVNPEEYYPLFDIFVFPTLWEGLPYVLLEAMASGLPVICSRIPNISELITENKSAITFEPDSSIDLFKKISVLYEDPKLRRKLGENALLDVTSFDETEMTKRIEEVYSEVMVN